MRWLLHKLFGCVFVLLEDFDRDLHIRRVRFVGTAVPMAYRMGFRISPVILLQDGTTAGAIYVKRWHRLLGEPFRVASDGA